MLPPQIIALRPELELQVIDGLRLLLDRYEAAGDYPFVDMKLKVLTGEEFPAPDPARRSIYDRDVIYGVIQGRAIESIAGHIGWLPSAATIDSGERDSLQERARRMLREVVDSLEALRAASGGQMYFMMSTEGGALRVAEDGRVEPWAPPPGNTDTDVFYAKGLVAAARCLGDDELLAVGDAAFRSVSSDVLNGSLLNDRQPMDPKNEVRPIPGRFTHGPKMLSIGGAAVGIEAGLGPWYWQLGACLIRDVVAGHLNLGQFPELQPHDFVEFIDPAGRPWRDEGGQAWCDPGHALEFIGLAGKVLLAMRAAPEDGPPEILPALGRLAEAHFPRLFEHLFGLGFNREKGGICKAYDLAGRKPINADMPWWNLPETLRAAAELMVLVPDTNREPLAEAALACHHASMTHYARSDLNHLPLQTRAADGRPIDVIPAMPDADPLYHTGLSLIDVLRLCKGENPSE